MELIDKFIKDMYLQGIDIERMYVGMVSMDSIKKFIEDYKNSISEILVLVKRN